MQNNKYMCIKLYFKSIYNDIDENYDILIEIGNSRSIIYYIKFT